MNSQEELFLEHISPRTHRQPLRVSQYYLEAVKKYDGSFRCITWNWAAFLGSIYWMVYRRLYLHALVFLFGKIILGILFARLGLLPFIIPHIFLGMFGTTLYLDFTMNRIKQEKLPLGTDGAFACLVFMIVEIATVAVILRAFL